ncbi:MAG: pyrroline-5-carboxylate reductase [Lachnospiraceae bacterium]|nr:pyrroline-5-carboxylate reductase [Lachnospiraceae bacterium]
MKICFIGCGNMARAMLGGIIKNGVAPKEDITASAKTEATRRRAAEQYGIRTCADNREAVRGADVIILAVKPGILPEVAEEIKDAVSCDQLLLSVAAGKTIAELESFFGSDKKIVRAMPNVPAQVGAGMTGYCANANTAPADRELTASVLNSFGRASEVAESQMPAVTAVSGSAPAYIFMLIEAMADAAVLEGMKRADAYTFAAQTVLGSAKMVLETGEHPGVLKDMVCSPAGTTIEGLAVLEREGFRSAVIEALRSCTEKSKQI